MDKDIKRDFLILVGIALIAKVCVALLTTMQFNSFIDLWDMSYYFESMTRVASGQIPYWDFPFDYPILAWIPIILAFTVVPSLPGFFFVFEFLMLICDALTIFGIYMIALQIWGSKTRAFRSGLLYAISLPVAYFTLVRFDPLPVCLMVWAVWFTLKGRATEGYLASLIGFLVKIFPIVLIPFFTMWNAKGKDLKKEILDAGFLTVIFVVPAMFMSGTFSNRVGSAGQVYANTPTYLVHMYLAKIAGLGIAVDTISALFYVIAGIVFICLAIAFLRARKSPVMLLTTLLLATFTIVFVARLHSPQYLMWYMPFLCLLVSEEITMSVILFVSQVVAYFEFPILFGRIYTNAEYLYPIKSAMWYQTVIFFSLEYLVMLCLLIMIIRKNYRSFL